MLEKTLPWLFISTISMQIKQMTRFIQDFSSIIVWKHHLIEVAKSYRYFALILAENELWFRAAWIALTLESFEPAKWLNISCRFKLKRRPWFRTEFYYDINLNQSRWNFDLISIHLSVLRLLSILIYMNQLHNIQNWNPPHTQIILRNINKQHIFKWYQRHRWWW